MSVAQALAVAAAAWITAMAPNSCMTGAIHGAHSRFESLLARTGTTTAIQLARIEGGFRTTPDGVRMEPEAVLR